MPTNEIVEARAAVPFPVDETLSTEMFPGLGFAILQWQPPGNGEAPPYWSPTRDAWLRTFVDSNDPLKSIAATWINKLVTVPWAVIAHDRSIDRHVRRAKELTASFRRNSGSMASSPLKGWKEFQKMFWQDYLTQDNGAFAVVLGDGPADGPVVGAPFGLLHLDSALCVRTKNPEFPVKYMNSGRGGDGHWYKIHYTRIIEMANMPSANTDLNGVGRCPVSCCLAPAQELWDIWRYHAEMFGSRPPRQILYAKKGATVASLEQAIQHWNMKLDNESRQRFGGTLIAAPAKGVGELELDTIDLSQMPEGFNRRDATTINMSAIAAAFGMDLRDVAYTLGAPSRTGDAEVQDRKGRGKGVGEALETFTERFNEVCVGENFFIRFDYLDDEQDEQAASIRAKKSEARQRDMMAGLTTIRVERELMWESNEISAENFADMELADGRLPDGLDVLLLFQSQDEDYKEWLDIGESDPTNVTTHDAEQMILAIHEQYILVSEYVHLQTRPERRRKARQALAALDKLRLMYEEQRDLALQQEQMEQQQAMQQQALDNQINSKVKPTASPTPPANPGESPTGKKPAIPVKKPPSANSMTKEVLEVLEVVEKQVEEVDTVLAEYDQQLTALVDYALSGEVPQARFDELLAQVVFAVLLAIFLRGARKSEATLTEAEWADFFTEAEPHYQAIRSLSDDLYGGRYAANNMAAYTRVRGWLNMASGFFSWGRPTAPMIPSSAGSIPSSKNTAVIALA